MDNQLVEVIKVNEIPEEAAKSLQKNFGPFVQRAEEWRKKVDGLVVTSDDQKKEMMLAREARLALADIRKQAKECHRVSKADALRYGRAVDGMFNIIKAIVEPLEEHLKKQEDFTKIREAAIREKLISDRTEKLSDLGLDPSIYNLADMPDEIFDGIVNARVAAIKAEEAEAAEAEKKRMEAEAAERKETERIRLENEKLKKDAEEKEKAAAKEKKEADAKLAKERQAREKLEKEKAEHEAEEARAKKEAEAKAKAEAEAKAKAERDAALAPDRDKLAAWSKMISAIDLPVVESKEAKEVAMKATAMLLDVVAFVKRESVNL